MAGVGKPTGHAATLWLVATLAVLASAPSAGAAALVVNSTGDDGAMGSATNGVCDTGEMVGADPECTLRAAIEEANGTGEPDSITFSLTAPATIGLGAAGWLTIDAADPVEITGPGASSLAISGNDATRVLLVSAGSTATIRGLTLRDGAISGSDGSLPGSGGTDAAGGAINNAGALTLDGVTLRDNVASGGDGAAGETPSGPGAGSEGGRGGDAAGGAILNAATGSLTVLNSTLTANTASAGDGGTGGAGNDDDGGGGGAGGDASGGAIAGEGTMTVQGTTVSENRAEGGAGGTGGAAGAGGTGGGVGSAGDGLGGAIATAGSATLEATHVTLAGNTGTVGANLAAGGTAANLRATILADLTAGAGPQNCSGQVTSLGFNLDDGDSCGLEAVTNDLENTEPQLAALAADGPTATHALPATSPAVDAVTSGCPPPATDQRGLPRPAGPACDIGSFELQPPTEPGPDITPPETSIHSGPKRKTKKRRALFTFSASEPGATFQCAVNRREVVACSSPHKVRVKPGRHRFRVWATDVAGNLDPIPALWKWKVKRKRR